MSSANTIKVAYNRCYGGLTLSKKAVIKIIGLKAMNNKWSQKEIEPVARLIVELDHSYDSSVETEESLKSVDPELLSLIKSINNIVNKIDSDHSLRNDPELIAVIESLGSEANGSCSKIEIKEIPSEYKDCYIINEYDGSESVVCDPAKLITYKLQQFAPNYMTATNQEKDDLIWSLIQLSLFRP